MSPAATACEAKWVACWLEPHMRLGETAGTETGKSASITARRPTLAPCSPVWVTVPLITSSTASGSMSARSTRPWRAWASRASGRSSRKAPPRRANGVRTASRITGSFISYLLTKIPCNLVIIQTLRQQVSISDYDPLSTGGEVVSRGNRCPGEPHGHVALPDTFRGAAPGDAVQSLHPDGNSGDLL